MGKMTPDYCRKLIMLSKRILHGEICLKTSESMLLLHRILPIVRQMSQLTLTKKDILTLDNLLHTPLPEKEKGKTALRPHNILKQMQYGMMFSNDKSISRSKVDSD